MENAIVRQLYCLSSTEACGWCRCENPNSVNDTRDIAQNGQQDVDTQVLVATVVHQDTDRWKEDCGNKGQNTPASKPMEINGCSEQYVSRWIRCWLLGRLNTGSGKMKMSDQQSLIDRVLSSAMRHVERLIQ